MGVCRAVEGWVSCRSRRRRPGRLWAVGRPGDCCSWPDSGVGLACGRGGAMCGHVPELPARRLEIGATGRLAHLGPALSNERARRVLGGRDLVGPSRPRGQSTSHPYPAFVLSPTHSLLRAYCAPAQPQGPSSLADL